MASDAGPGFGGWFAALFVLVALLSVAGAVWRILAARKISADAGLDPNKAAAVTLLSRDGVGAAYLASTLAQRASPESLAAPEAPKTAEQRLVELQALKDKMLISDEEFEVQRQKILGSI